MPKYVRLVNKFSFVTPNNNIIFLSNPVEFLCQSSLPIPVSLPVMSIKLV